MKILLVAGPPSVGKTALIKCVIENLNEKMKIVYFKSDVMNAYEDEELKEMYHIDTKKIYTGDLCPDHAEVMVLSDVIHWGKYEKQADLLIIESAGLCLRCSPYLNQGLGIVVMNLTAGINSIDKMGAMISLADIIVLTKQDLVSQAEREVFIQKVCEEHSKIICFETNALQGNSLQKLYQLIENMEDIDEESMVLKGNPPLGTCTICVGNKSIGWKNHFGVVRQLDGDLANYLYRGD